MEESIRQRAPCAAPDVPDHETDVLVLYRLNIGGAPEGLKRKKELARKSSELRGGELAQERRGRSTFPMRGEGIDMLFVRRRARGCSDSPPLL